MAKKKQMQELQPPRRYPQARVRLKQGCSPSEAAKIDRATRGLNTILAHPRYQEEVLKRTYADTTDSGFIIYSKQCDGNQGAIGDDLSVVDFNIALYNSRRWSRVVGYTYLESLVIYMNRKFFSTPKYIASNEWHEGNHQLGYVHATDFERSVPYQMNDIIELLWDELEIDKKLG